MADDERLARIEGKLDRVITKFEASEARVDDFDDRLSRNEITSERLAKTAKDLADAQMRLSLSRVVTKPSWRVVMAVMAAAVLGGVTAEFTRDALAHKPDVELQYRAKGNLP